jgi:hypothetical protein
VPHINACGSHVGHHNLLLSGTPEPERTNARERRANGDDLAPPLSSVCPMSATATKLTAELDVAELFARP